MMIHTKVAQAPGVCGQVYISPAVLLDSCSDPINGQQWDSKRTAGAGPWIGFHLPIQRRAPYDGDYLFLAFLIHPRLQHNITPSSLEGIYFGTYVVKYCLFDSNICLEL